MLEFCSMLIHWRGINGTLGPSFNAAKHAKQAKLELRIDLIKIDHQQCIVNGEGLMQVWLKCNTVGELLLYYSK